jgi:hypothetical protein
MKQPVHLTVASCDCSPRQLPNRAAILLILGALALCGGATRALAARYPNMAPIAEYRTASRAQEIALARSAAPPSISDHAEILVLGKRGYETAVKGSNGFVCLVVLSWDMGFDNPEFWNPKIRSPQCFNAAAAHSLLGPRYLARTRWVLAGDSIAEMRARTEASKPLVPAPGSVCYMMSKKAYLNDSVAGPWYAHVMFFGLDVKPADWGANLPGSQVAADSTNWKPITLFMVIVQKWSDGTPNRKL